MSMNLAKQVSAVAIAYCVMVNMCWIVDAFFHTYVSIGLIVWLNLGVMILKLKNIRMPMPSKRYIDVVGGLHILFQALTWPIRI